MIDYKKLKEYNNADNELKLWPYQQENKNKVYDVWMESRSVMLQMPTGTGKTRTFVSIMNDIYNYSRDVKHAYKILVLVHRKELVDQIHDEITLISGKACGIIMAGEREHKKIPFQVASVRSLSNRLESWKDKQFDFVIIDEAHHTTAQSYQQIIKAFPNAKLLGVTATPCRLSGDGFTVTFEKLILSPSIKWFIDEGYLSDYDYYSVPRWSYIQREIDGIKKFSNGDYAEDELERVCDNDRIRAQVFDTYIKYANGKKGIVYTINKTHNKNLCEKFVSNGITAVALDSDTPKEIREDYLEDFKKGIISVIFNVNLFTEGFDCPDVEFVQLARPTKSLALYLQQVGRALRKSEGKEKALILDDVGLYYKFGFPKDRRNWERHFEGRFDSENPDIEEDNQKKATVKIDTVKRTRHQNLEEGNEKVILIQTSDDKDYIEIKADEFGDFLEEVFEYLVKSIVSIYKDNYDGIGLELSINGEIGYNIFDVRIVQQTNELSQMLKTSNDKNNNHSRKTKRVAIDYSELLDQIKNDIWEKLENQTKNQYSYWKKQFDNFDFTSEEIIELMPIIEKRMFITDPFNDIILGNVSLKALLNCIWQLFARKNLNAFNFISLGIVDYILNQNFRKQWESITKQN